MKFRKREMVCQILKNNSILTIRKDKKKKRSIKMRMLKFLRKHFGVY